MNAKMIMVAGTVTVLVVVAVCVFLWWRRRKRPLNQGYFKTEWSSLQKLLKNKERWDVALMQADNLLDIALRKKHYRGKSMGERMVKAQRIFTDNDSLWFAHKLRNKIESDPKMKLKEADLKQALIGLRQALKDLGALPDGK